MINPVKSFLTHGPRKVQFSATFCGEEHCVTALKMAVERTSESGVFQFNVFYCMWCLVVM